MLDPTAYWGDKPPTRIPQQRQNRRGAFISAERLLDGCVLYRVEWNGSSEKSPGSRQLSLATRVRTHKLNEKLG